MGQNRSQHTRRRAAPNRRARVALAGALGLSALFGGACSSSGDGGSGTSSTSPSSSSSLPPATNAPVDTSEVPPMVIEGRPWRRGLRRRIWRARSRWLRHRPVAPDPTVAALPAPQRAALAEVWARAGEHEHASIPAFVDLADALRRHGAPAALVARCEAAADDERDHTDRCFALASRYAGHEVRPGRLPRKRPWARPTTPALERLAVESLRDGLVNEGFAAALAATRLDAATDVEARATLAVIARDEAAHAALGADLVAWCVAAGGAPVRDAVRRAAAALQAPVAPDLPAGLDPEVAAAHGAATPRDAAALGGAACAPAHLLAERLAATPATRAARVTASV